MEVSMILRTIEKVDQAVARLQELQTSIATTRMNLETNGNSELQKSCRRSRSPSRIDCHDFLGGYKRLAQCAEIFHMKEREVPAVSEAKWRQWSVPAETVHQAMSEILLASRFSKEMAALLADSVEQLRHEEEHQEKLKDDEENSVLHKDVVLPMQGSAGKIEVSNDIIYSAKDECAETSTHGTNPFGNEIALASSLVDGSHSFLLNESSNMSMEATKIKSAQKLWEISLPTKAVMCPNHSFASNRSLLPSSPTLLKTSTALKRVDALPFANKSKLIGPKQSISRVSSQQRPSFSGKFHRSPVTSVSTKVEVMMSTKRKTSTACRKLTSSSAGSGLAKQPQNCEEFPIYYANLEAKKPLKVPSHQSHVDTSDRTRKSHGYGLSDRQSVSQQRSSVRLSKMKTADGQMVKKQQTRDFQTKLKAFELVKDKENLQLAGCTPAALCLKGNWFAGNERVLTLTKRKFG